MTDDDQGYPDGIMSYVGNTHQFYASHYSDVGIPSQFFMWTVASHRSDVLTVDNTGRVTIVGAGEDMVKVSFFSAGYDVSYEFKIDAALLPDGTYFLKNKRTEKYVDIFAQNMSNGTDIHQWDFHGGNTQRWIFSYLGEGYYTFKSANSSDNYYLGVKNDGTATDTQIVLRTGTITDGMKWKISETASGAYKITPKTGEPNDRVLAVEWFPAASFTDNTFSFNGLKIRQRDYVDDGNYKDEWTIIKAIYGSKDYKEIKFNNPACRKTNCHGYAMQQEYWPGYLDNDVDSNVWIGWTDSADEYILSIYQEYWNHLNNTNTDFSDTVKSEYADCVCDDFENWLGSNNIIGVKEDTFSGNGECNELNVNQYRVVLRVGVYLSYSQIGNVLLIELNRDYHFWYQTYDGTWANKHGDKATVHLDNEVIPSTYPTSGWDLLDGDYYYNSEIFSFIITE